MNNGVRGKCTHAGVFCRERHYKFRPGETVLIEYSSDFPYYLAFYYLIRAVRREGIPVLIDDIGDTLSRYAFALETSGIETSFLNDEGVYVIKIGGKRNIGNVSGRIGIESDFYVHNLEYSRVFENILCQKDFFVNFVLGFDTRLLMTPNPRDRFSFLVSKLHYLGNERRVAFYFVNSDVISGYTWEREYLREMVTSLVQLERDGEQYVVRVVKSPDYDAIGSFNLPKETLIRLIRGEG